ncbi:MAG: ABC transporter permease [Bacteroidales bacterium]|nr:ABC transporter permease [Bacteroidales bacterium]
MIRNYLKTALRNLQRNQVHGLVIIIGLATGLAAVFIISIFLKHEYSYDRFFKDSERISRAVTILDRDGSRMPYTFEDAAFEAKKAIPEIQAATRFYAYNYLEVNYQQERKGDYKALYSDSSFFEVFSLPMLEGDATTALNQPGTVILTRSMKQKIFGDDPAINEVLQMNRKDYLVRGIMEDIPENCHFGFDVLVSFSSLSSSFRESNAVDYPAFFLFRQPPDQEVKNKVNDFMAKWVNEKFAGYDVTVSSALQPLEQIHMGSGLKRDYAITADKNQMFIFTVVAGFILMIAVFNFLNLFTAQSESRLKEVGLRKVIGSRRRQLIWQFLFESALIGLLAFLLAMFLVETFLPEFFELLRVDFDFSFSTEWLLILVFFLFTLLVGMASAWYPALYVSSFNPVRVFQGSLGGGRAGKPFRTGLVILQFTLSIGLITAMITLYTQVQYMKNKDVGFDREHVAYFYGFTDPIKKHYESIKNELLRNPRITAVTASMSAPGGKRSPMDLRRTDQQPEEAFSCKENRVQPGYLKTYGIELLRGRDFTAPHDKEEILINQAVVRRLGFEDPLGKEVILWKRRCRIIGVVKDYNFRSLHREIEPLVLSHYYDLKYILSARLQGNVDPSMMDYVKGVFHRHDPEYTFRYRFVDQVYSSLYGKEERLNTLILVAATLGILLSVIGLFAFVSLMLNKRVKEMGIRKAFGASAGDVNRTVARTIGLWILISALMGWTIAYVFSSHWLENFSYRIELQWWMFAASAAIVMLLAASAVAGKVLHLSRVNPADILRYE